LFIVGEEGKPASSSSAEVLPAAGAYTAREEFLQKLEQEGQLSFKYVLNDGHPDNSVWCAPAPWGSPYCM